MNRARAEKILSDLGYEIDWYCTGASPEGGWYGTIDAIGRHCIDGDCRGEVVFGANAADWYRNAIAAAKSYGGRPEPCQHPIGKCPFHDE